MLFAKQNLFETEPALTARHRLHLLSVVQLYKALGETWSPQGLYFRYIHEGVVRVGFVNRQDISHDGCRNFLRQARVFDSVLFLKSCG